MTIEKFTGSFSQEPLGVTQITNKAIKLLMKDADALGVYVYLMSLPPTWELKAKHLMSELDMSKDRFYRLLNFLLEIRLISCIEIREGGRFIRNHYTVHHRQVPPCPEIQEMVVSPCPEIQDPVIQDPVNQDVYITKTPEILDPIKQTTTTESSSLASPSGESDRQPIINIEIDSQILEAIKGRSFDEAQTVDFLKSCKYFLEHDCKVPDMAGKVRVLLSLIKNGTFTKPSGYGQQSTPSLAMGAAYSMYERKEDTKTPEEMEKINEARAKAMEEAKKIVK